MKKYTTKRVLAGVLAVMTVAGPMTANVGGFLQQTAIVANAYDAQVSGSTAWTKDTLTEGDFFESNVTLSKANANTDKFNIVLTVGGDSFEKVYVKSDNTKTAITSGDGIEYNAGTFTFEDVKSVKYIATNTDSTPAKRLEITVSQNNTVYVVSNGDSTTSDTEGGSKTSAALKGLAVRVAQAEYNAGTKTQTIQLANYDVDETSVDYNIDEPLRPYITKIVYTSALQSKVVTLTGESAKEQITFEALPKTDITIVAKAKLGGQLAEFKPTFSSSTGEFTYKFKAIEGRNIALENVVVNYSGEDVDPVAKDVQIIREADKKEADWYDLTGNNDPTGAGVNVGQTITVRSAYPFTIEDAKLKSIKTDGTYETDDVTGVYKDGAFQATFVVAGDLDVKLSALPTTLTYTTSGTKVTANGTKDGVKIIENATASSLTVTKNVPVYADADKKIIKKDDDDKEVYTKTAIANNKSVAYDKDENAFVELDFDVDKNLLGRSGQTNTTDANTLYQIVVTKNGSDAKKKEISTVSFDEDGNLTKTTFQVGTGDPEEGVYPHDFTPIFDPENDEGTFPKGINVALRNAGKYNVQLLVWGKNAAEGAKICETTFTITPATNVTESDFTMLGFYKSDLDENKFDLENTVNELGESVDKGDAFAKYLDLKQAIKVAEDEDKAAAEKALKKFLKDTALTVTKNSSGVYEVACESNKLKTDADATVTLFAVLPDGTDCEVTGTKISGEMDKVKNAGLQITDDNYNVKEFSIKWKLVEKAVDDAILFEIADDDKDKTVVVSGDDREIGLKVSYADIEKAVKAHLKGTNNVDVSNATFKYSEGAPLIDDGFIDIDALNTGLPTDPDDGQDHNEDKYYIYANVGSLETAEPLLIVIGETQKTKVETVLTKTKFTYGETITIDDIAFVEQGKDTVIEGLAIKADADDNDEFLFEDTNGRPVAASENKITYSIQKINAKGQLTGEYVTNAVGFGHLVPGKYRVTLMVDDGLLDNSADYDVVQQADEDVVANAKQRTFDITVSKRQLTPEMFIFPEDHETIEVPIVSKVAKLTDAMFNDPNQYQPTFFGVDTPKIKIVGGDSSKTAVGQYAVSLGVVDDTAADKKWTDLYTGSASVPWFAVDEAAITEDQAALLANVDFEFVLDKDESYKADNIYKDKNGVQIHAQVQLVDKTSDPDEYGNHKILTNTQFNKLKIAKYGFVYEKKDVLKDLKNTEADIAKAEEYLQVGIGNTPTNTHSKDTYAISGINSVVSTVEDYIWIRPYLITEAGQVIYGEARRLDFQTVANQVINPQLGELALVQKDDNIYYYAYASKVTKDEAGYRTATPDKFGVVLSRTGNYATYDPDIEKLFNANDDVDAGAYDPITGKVGFIDTTAFADDKEKMAYYNELKKAYSVTVDNRDAQSDAVKGTKYTEDECGTLVRITDSLSRVYVRTYVDFGNGLVVYSAPTAHDSASSILATKFSLETDEVADAGNGTTYKVQATRAEAPGAFSELLELTSMANYTQKFDKITLDADDVAAFGLILDADGKVYKSSFDKYQFLIGKGFTQYLTEKDAKAKTDAGVVSYGAATSWKEDKISARAYLKYMGIDVYGNVLYANGDLDDSGI